MSSVAWYWHRLRAMGPAEMAGHGRRKVRQLSDRLFSTRRFDGVQEVTAGEAFPILPRREAVPASLREALERDVADILDGRWIAFGHLELQVDDPPLWHKDYLAGVDMATDKPALKLHHRLEGAADIKLIWEPSRWYSLVRLAQGAYLLQDRRASDTCLRLLEDWIQKNPPYFGWNWTSALETGLRLIQFAWIDALLAASFSSQSDGGREATGNGPSCVAKDLARLARVRANVLLPHLWFTWRDRSFGTSANNHLIGELAGLIIALVRWPRLTRWAAPLPKLQVLWEREVLKQFAPDGGNREQALNYHLFSFEFCWLARLALVASGNEISAEAEDRLRAAANYFTAIQVENDQWNYGDSDSAYVTPLFENWSDAASEWHRWFKEPASSPSIQFWIGNTPKPLQPSAVVSGPNNWRVYPESGFAVCAVGDWFLRWDLSPLGYLATASHGHCDALHLSLWHRGEAIVIDPGTGCYHHDRPLRDYLSSWAAHNGPHSIQTNFPERKGAFLWSAHHAQPRWSFPDDRSIRAELTLPGGVAQRTITWLPAADGWQIDDAFEPENPTSTDGIEVFWELSPKAGLSQVNHRTYGVGTGGASIVVELNEVWSAIMHGSPAPNGTRAQGKDQLRGVCSPAFRKTQRAPWVLLHGPAGGRTALRTTFRAR